MRKIVLLIATIVIMTSLAGCLGGEAKDKKKPPELIMKHATIMSISGWAESNWASSNDEPWIVDTEIPISLNESNIVQVKFTIKVEDSDTEHSETDEGSTPDKVKVSAMGGNVTTEESQGTTTATMSIEANAPTVDSEVDYLSSDWKIHLQADCYGGKRYKIGPIPIPGMQYKDQGVAYTISGEYTYMVVEESEH